MLGDELRKARIKAGLTQEALALKAGVTREFISIIENDHQSPSVDTFVGICDAMGVEAWTLLKVALLTGNRGEQTR